jgi:hypothetical protein
MASIDDARRRRLNRGNKELVKEVTAQFTGSDLEVGYTFVYVWLCNQFGHFMLGFAGTLALSWLVTLPFPHALAGTGVWSSLWPAALVGLAWLLIWIGKEVLLDVADGLGNLRIARSQRDAAHKNLPPPPAIRAGRFSRDSLRDVWRVLQDYYGMRVPTDEEDWFRHDIVRDSAIDCWFYFAGTTTAIAALTGPGIAAGLGWPWLAAALPIATMLVTFLLSISRSRDWLWEKVAFDKADLPFVGRFALNSRPVEPEMRQRALGFALDQHQPGHLVLIGPPKSGRTTTAVSLGVEALLRADVDTVVYTTLCKLLDRVAEQQPAAQEPQGPPGDRPMWPPENAQLLIVDDVGAQGGQAPVVTAAAFGAELRANAHLRQVFQNKRVIWVIGDNPARAEAWENAIAGALGTTARVASVVPGVKTIPLAERRRAA